jgi:hypothetical protein
MIRSKIKRLKGRRSSKLILVVAGGVALVLLAFFALVIVGGGSGGSPERTLRYLKRTEGLAALDWRNAKKQVVLVFNSASKNASKFEQVAHFAALRLARAWPDCEVLLGRDRADQVVYRIQVKDGMIANEDRVSSASSRPR